MNDRRDPQPNDLLSFGPFSLLTAERLLKKADESIPLGGRALDILIALVERAGEVITHRELISTVWPGVTVEDANLRAHIAALRKALGDGRDGARYVSNVAGRGYCFVAPVTRSSARQPVPITGITPTERVQRLPPRLTRMVGRDDTVRSLAQQLQMWRFVSIVGPGGVGKTTVAISVAHTLVDGFHDAVFFIDLAALTDPQLVPTAVASALGLMVQTQDPLVGLLTFIGDRKMPHIGNVRVALGWALTMAMLRSASNLPPGRRPCSSDCRCWRNAGVGANGHRPLSTMPAEAPDRR
jgi:DNA-binding winged helix-turn-helix (wHTH) protein